MGAPVVMWQILSSRPDDVSKFYETVFGWSSKRDNALGYRQVNTGSTKGIHGGVWPAPDGAPTFIQLFIEVGDMDATIDAIVKGGGSILVPKSALPEGDTMAVVKDPFGLSVGLVSSR